MVAYICFSLSVSVMFCGVGDHYYSRALFLAIVALHFMSFSLVALVIFLFHRYLLNGSCLCFAQHSAVFGWPLILVHSACYSCYRITFASHPRNAPPPGHLPCCFVVHADTPFLAHPAWHALHVIWMWLTGWTLGAETPPCSGMLWRATRWCQARPQK